MTQNYFTAAGYPAAIFLVYALSSVAGIRSSLCIDWVWKKSFHYGESSSLSVAWLYEEDADNRIWLQTDASLDLIKGIQGGIYGRHV